MKKLMTIAAVALCTAAIADTNSGICSTAVVGYANKDTASTGFAMLGAQFESIGATDGSATLSDIKVSGYDKYDANTDEGGTSGDFIVQFLTSTGTLEAYYAWYDDDERTGWFARSGEAADDVKLEAAKGVWVYGQSLTMTTAGGVNTKDIVVKTGTGFKAIANTFPVDIKLSQLAITGYDSYDPATDEGGTTGDFVIQFLTPKGALEAYYAWYDDDERTGWFSRSGESAADVTIPAGTGVWVYGSGLTVRIPAPEL